MSTIFLFQVLFVYKLSIALQYEDKTPSGNKSESTKINEFEIWVVCF